MNQMHCPHCGWRPLNEFRYGGELRARPPQAKQDTADWTAYLYVRGNPLGDLREWWYHRLGCGTWFVAERHTKTHAIRNTQIGSSPAED